MFRKSALLLLTLSLVTICSICGASGEEFLSKQGHHAQEKQNASVASIMRPNQYQWGNGGTSAFGHHKEKHRGKDATDYTRKTNDTPATILAGRRSSPVSTIGSLRFVRQFANHEPVCFFPGIPHLVAITYCVQQPSPLRLPQGMPTLRSPPV